jgi:uncharacterized membrane protein required for colicin V production
MHERYEEVGSEMDWLGSASPLDGVILAVLLVAIARGIFTGLIREAFSVAALAGALIAARFFTAPAAAWLTDATSGQIGSVAAPWIMGALIVIGSVGVIATLGRLLRRGAQLAGLSWADRLGGAAIGAAEGALVALVIVLASTWTVGRDHPAVADSRSLAAYDEVTKFVDERGDELPKVAAPGKWD